MKIARVLITTRCNLSCTYCCNKIPEIQDSFKMTTFDQFINMKYDVVNISGGEPMLEVVKLYKLLYKLKFKPNSPKRYLYTNGYIEKSNDVELLGSFLDGVNIGYHNTSTFDLLSLYDWSDACSNVILHYNQDKHLPDYILNVCQYYNIKWKGWKMNECNNIKEDRWII